MINAKNEFIGHIGNKKVLCCCLIMEEKSLELTTGWTNDDWNLFDYRHGSQIRPVLTGKSVEVFKKKELMSPETH